ncbi:hypothetical protein AB0J71_35920 [Nonomuraea sp. NPDC049637]|uniref:hypothetical protein n=1 Tax=Nonomuraea sp. NPDC049637 TaxID=3154356 RepID=UPI00342D24AE
MRPIPAVSAAVALALVCATPAAAAPGIVRLFSPDGQSRIITNPQPNQCHPGFGPGSSLLNRTSGIVLVFPDSNCRIQVFDPVEPGTTKQGNIGSFRALD